MAEAGACEIILGAAPLKKPLKPSSLFIVKIVSSMFLYLMEWVMVKFLILEVRLDEFKTLYSVVKALESA